MREENKSGVVSAKKKGNILVVDDEEFICDLFKESLSEADHCVVTTSSGEDAIEHGNYAAANGDEHDGHETSFPWNLKQARAGALERARPMWRGL